MTYEDMLKAECHYNKPEKSTVNTASILQKINAAHQSNIPIETLKQSLTQGTSEILRKVLARSDSLNLLRQIIDVKARKIKPKSYDGSIF
jgi:hypothetical protein